MRVRDIRSNTEYATCDGKLVVTGESTDAGWVQWRSDDPPERYKPTEEDPWSNCSTSSGKRRAWAKGVRVTEYAFDRDGKRIEDKKADRVMKPADIVGTWVEYMTLHADVVRGKHLVRDAFNAREELEKWLNKTYGYSDPDSKYTDQYGHERSRAFRNESRFTVRTLYKMHGAEDEVQSAGSDFKNVISWRLSVSMVASNDLLFGDILPPRTHINLALEGD